MKKYLLHYMLAVSLLLNFVMIYKVIRLGDSMDEALGQIRQLSGNASNQVNCINSNVESMIDDRLKEQNKILDSFEVSFGKVNPADSTVSITVSAVPVETNDAQKAFLLMNDRETPMQKTGVLYTVTDQVSLFEDLKLKVVLEQTGTKKTESIDEYYNLMEKFLLCCNSSFDGSYSTNENQTVMADGTVHLDFNCNDENKPEKINIVQKVNNKIVEVNRLDMENKNGRLAIITDGYGGILSVDQIAIDAKQKVKPGDHFMIYAYIKDSYGFTYSSRVLECRIDKNGNWEDTTQIDQGNLGSIFEIKNPSGELVYPIKERVSK